MGQPVHKNTVCAVVGFALGWYFFPPGFVALFFSAEDAFACQVWNGVLLLVLAALAVAAAVWHGGVERFIARRRATVLAAVVLGSLAGYGLLAWSSALAGPLFWLVLMLSILLVACGYAALALSWACVFAHMAPARAVCTVAASMLFYALLSFVGWGTGQTGALLNAVTPCVSGVLWFAMGSAYRSGDDAPAEKGRLFALVRDLPWVQLGLMALFLVGGRIVVGFFFDYTKDTFGVEFLARNTLIALIMAFVLVRLRRATDPYQCAYAAWIPVAAVFLFGALLQLALGGTMAALGCGIINGMLCCFECISYLMLLQYVQRRGVSPVLVFGLWLAACKALPIFIQRCVTAQIMGLLDLPSDISALPVVFVVMVVISGTLALTSRTAGVAPAGCDGEGGGSFAEFESACTAAGLTPREREIVLLIAQGNSQKRIGELLGLSYSTVQSYAKGIYPKMGVHSKQELVDLIAGMAGRPGV